MRISSRLDYAVSCILRVADRYNTKKPVPVEYVSGKEKLEIDYVEQLLVKMRRAGIIKSIRGPGGGYVLSRPPSEITARDIMVAIERDVLELVCFRKKGRKRKCVHLADCKIRGFWLKLRDVMEIFLKGYSLKDLLALRRRERNWHR